MSGSEVTLPPHSPRIPGNIAPPDFSGTLERLADETQVGRGPGGAWSVTKDTAGVGAAPSQQGLGGTYGKTAVLTTDPEVPTPAGGLPSDAWALATGLVGFFFGTPFPPDISGGNVGIDEELEFSGAGDEDELPVGHSEDPYVAPSGPKGVGKPPLGGTEEPSEVVNPAVYDWVDEVLGSFPMTPNTLSPEQTALLNQMQSDDPAKIYTALLSFADLDSLGLTQAEKDAVIAQLTQLSQVIANANAAGGSLVLKLTVPELVAAFLAGGLDYNDDTTVSQDHKDLFNSIMRSIGQGLAALNYESLVGIQEPSREYVDLTSGNPAQISTLLASLLGTTALPQGMTQEELYSLVKGLADLLSTLPHDALSSPDPTIIQQKLADLVQSLVDSGKIPQSLADLFTSSLLPGLSQQLAQINEAKLFQDLSSGDPAITEAALIELSGVNSDPSLTQSERAAVMDYLKAMTVALCFMAQIRCLLTTLENQFSQELAAAKMATIADQLQQAQAYFLNQVEEISTSSLSQLHGIHTAKIMKYLMPIIAIAVAIMSIILIVVSIVATVVTAGAASGAILGSAVVVGKLIALTVALAVTTVALAVTIADAACQWSKSKGLFEMIAASANVDDPAAVAAIGAAFEMAIMIFTAIVTLGVAGIVGAVKMAAYAVQMTIKQAIMSLLRALGDAILKESVKATIKATLFGSVQATAISTAFIGVAMTGLMPILIKGLTEALKAMGADDKTAAIIATILAMVLSLGFMLLTGGKGARGAAKTGATNVGAALDSGFQSAKASMVNLKEAIINFGEKLVTILKSGAKGIGNTVSDAIEQLLKRLQDFAKGVAENLVKTLKNVRASAGEAAEAIGSAKGLGAKLRALLDSDAFKSGVNVSTELLAFVELVLRCTALGIQARASYTQARMKASLAELREEQAEIESMIVLLAQLEGADQTETIDRLGECSQERSENWLKLVQLVSSFTEGASQSLTGLTTQGAA